MSIKRALDLSGLLNKKSHFLFGPRATGKSTLIKNELDNARILLIDLLHTNFLLRLSERPYELEDIIENESRSKDIQYVVIDEIQKVPILLNEVHRLIESKKITFLLTGSSTRNLKKSGTNLLAGRAWQTELFPLTWKEISDQENFDLEKYLLYGGLPAVYTSSYPADELEAYVNTFLTEEIKAEGLIRKFTQFSKFLNFSALTNGDILNFSSLGSDAQISPNTIREYFRLLEDTLIGFTLNAWTKSKKRKPVATAKFYFFDLGIVNKINNITRVESKTELFGKVFEHFIILEARAASSYLKLGQEITYWRTHDQNEVDLLLGNEIAVEIKTKTSANIRDARSLLRLKEEGIIKRFYLVSFDKINRVSDGITFMYWEDFLKKLWSKEL